MELKELKRYLGTGVKFMLSQTGIFNIDGEGGAPYPAYGLLDLVDIVITEKGYEVELIHKSGWGIGLIEPDEFTLALHPLSDLAKPCLEGGKVPIKELSRIFGGHDFDEHDLAKVVLLTEGCRCIDILGFPLKFIEKLYEWHFWLGDQSRFKEDIVDINNLPQCKK